jgi:glutamate-ammonia-ligase adenylyltransferase
VLRLCFDGLFAPDKAPDGLRALLARVGEAPDFPHLEADLAEREAAVAALFDTPVV